MGLSSLSRHMLFSEAADTIDRLFQYYFYLNKDAVRDVFYNSAQMIAGFEEVVNTTDLKMSADEYRGMFRDNAVNVDRTFSNTIESNIIKQTKAKTKNEEDNINSLTFKDYFRFLLKALSDEQERVIEQNYIVQDEIEDIRGNRKQTFLSYAYYDKGLSQALFYYFWKRDGFLYVNWMWDGTNPMGTITKERLESALNKSDQLLFLRTANSELRIKGNNNSIRQWCSWEIGNFYTKRKNEKYYTSFYDNQVPRNDILDSFNPMKDVIGGVMR